MKNIEVNSLGHSAEKSFPSTIVEFNQNAKNGLGDKADAALDLALDQYIAHDYLGKVRSAFIHGLPEEKSETGEIIHHAIKGTEALTGIARKSKPVLGKDNKPKVDSKGQPVTTHSGVETEGKCYERQLEELVSRKRFPDIDAAHAHFAGLYKSIIARIPVDLSESVRESKIAKLAAKYRNTAAVLLSRGIVVNYLKTVAKQMSKTITWEPAKTEPGVEVKMFTGKAPHRVKDKKTGTITETEVDFNVPEVDAESLGWIVKEHTDWVAEQARNAAIME